MAQVPDSLLRWAAEQEGVDPDLFRALVTKESNRRHDGVRSPVGAIGATQLMPGTARGLGVNPYDLRQNLRGGARYLRQQLDAFGGDVPKALAAYNAGPGAVKKYGGIPPFRETRDYVSKITAMLRGGGTGYGTRATAPATTGVGAVAGVTTGVEAADPREAILARLIGQGDLGRAVARKRFGGSPTPAASSGPVVSDDGHGHAASAGAVGGRVIGAPRDRPGARTNPYVVDFVKRVSRRHGPIQLGTGTLHNQFVAGTRRQSAHWTGNAIDLPASGATLTRLGQDLLIEAGMPEAIARKQRGGVYNVNGWNILFNTNIGGDHFGHAHAGWRGG